MKHLVVAVILLSSGFVFGDAVEDLTKRVEVLEKALNQTWNCSVVCKLWESGYANTFKGPVHASAATAAEALDKLNAECAGLATKSGYKHYFAVTAENNTIGASVKSACSK